MKLVLHTYATPTQGFPGFMLYPTLARPRPWEKHPTNQSLITLLTMVLTKNKLEFNGQHYLQTSGTAMGTQVASSHGNNFMDHFEDTHVYTPHSTPLWTNSLDSYQEFISHLNSCHKRIKYTAETSAKEVNFLDTTVSITDSRKLSITLYP